MFKTPKFWLISVFVVALVIRFLYFPDNVNFAYDQARDSFASLEILKGNLKIIGPPTTASDKIFHGALVYYIWAPIYFLSNHNPETVAAVMRVFNALGVFSVFYIAKNLFNPAVGLISAFLYAISFEQSQYSLFFGHPSLGVTAAMIFYFGLALWFFKQKPIGFIVALFGLGLTIQFEDANALLVLSAVAFSAIFYPKVRFTSIKTVLLGLASFCVVLSTFILAELKYNFRSSQAVFEQVFSHNSNLNVTQLGKVLVRFSHDNFISYSIFPVLVLSALTLFFVILVRKKDLRFKMLFLLVWLLGGLLPHVLNSNFTYYYSPAATVSLLILMAFLLYQLFNRWKILAIAVIIFITLSNISLTVSQNKKGPNSDIVIQPGMLTYQQKKVLDYIYQTISPQPFSVSAITVPLNINTTWSYLFEWYGWQKYGYLPVWGSEAASGFYGNLKVETARSDLPKLRFLIIEPTVGIEGYIVSDFIKHENYFSKVIDEKKFGTIVVQHRQQI